MKAQDFALLVKAEPRGRSQWAGCCPAHDDRRASLSIREGRDGRTLLKCFAGCPTSLILSRLGLKFTDLFTGPLPSPEELASIQARHAITEAKRLANIAEHARACNRVERAQVIVSTLGGALARHDNDETAALFAEALNLLRSAQHSLLSMKLN